MLSLGIAPPMLLFSTQPSICTVQISSGHSHLVQLYSSDIVQQLHRPTELLQNPSKAAQHTCRWSCGNEWVDPRSRSSPEWGPPGCTSFHTARLWQAAAQQQLATRWSQCRAQPAGKLAKLNYVPSQMTCVLDPHKHCAFRTQGFPCVLKVFIRAML